MVHGTGGLGTLQCLCVPHRATTYGASGGGESITAPMRMGRPMMDYEKMIGKTVVSHCVHMEEAP